MGNVNGKPLYIGYFGDVIEWCITNFNQYKSNLLNNDKILHVSDKTEEEYEEAIMSPAYPIFRVKDNNIIFVSSNIYSILCLKMYKIFNFNKKTYL